MKRTGLTVAAIGVGVPSIAAAASAISAHGVERDNPPTGRFLDVDGVRLHYTDEGSGAPIVLLHGNGVTVEDWRASGAIPQATLRTVEGAGHMVHYAATELVADTIMAGA